MNDPLITFKKETIEVEIPTLMILCPRCQRKMEWGGEGSWICSGVNSEIFPCSLIISFHGNWRPKSEKFELLIKEEDFISCRAETIDELIRTFKMRAFQ